MLYISLAIVTSPSLWHAVHDKLTKYIAMKAWMPTVNDCQVTFCPRIWEKLDNVTFRPSVSAAVRWHLWQGTWSYNVLDQGQTISVHFMLCLTKWQGIMNCNKFDYKTFALLSVICCRMTFVVRYIELHFSCPGTDVITVHTPCSAWQGDVVSHRDSWNTPRHYL